MSSLQDLYIADSYDGLLHANGDPIAATGKSKIYDGSGQETSLSLGIDGNGATVSGSLSTSDLKVGELTMPKVADSVGSVVVQGANNTLELSDSVSSTVLADLSPNPAGTYDSIGEIVVNSKGLVTQINAPTADSGERSITKTVYRSNAGSVYQQFETTVDGEWVKVSLPDNDNWRDAKAGIFFIKPHGLLTENRKFTYIIASPDKTISYPVIYMMGGEDAGGGIDRYGGGSQFCCPIGVDSSDTPVIYFALGNVFDANSTEVQTNWDLYLIARQQ